MGVDFRNEGRSMTYDAVEELFRTTKYPVLTAVDAAEAFDVSSQYANRRLKDLTERGLLERRRVGGSAVVYWLRDESRHLESSSAK